MVQDRRKPYQSKRLVVDSSMNISGILSVEGGIFSEEYQKDFLEKFKKEMNVWEASCPTLSFHKEECNCVHVIDIPFNK